MSMDKPKSQADDTVNVLKELLDDAAGKPGLPHELIQNLREKVDNDTLMVAILALVKAGKSTLMNAMVGQEFLPSMPEPETAVLVQVRHDPAVPQGKLFNMEGTLVSEGRTEIMDFLRAQNRKRRDLALNMEKEKQMAVQKQLEDALWKPVTGNFETANGVTKLFIRRIPNGQMWVCVQIRNSRRSGVLTGPLESGGYMVNTFSDIQRYADSPQQIKMRFDGTGIIFQRRHNTQTAWDDAQVAEKVISEAPAGLYARCIRGRWVKGMLFSAENGVEHRCTSDELSGEKGTYCLVGTTFFVYDISRFMIKDCNGWMNKFDMTGEPQFEFVYDHDLIEGQPVRIKDHDPSVPIGIIKKIEGQKARVAFHDGPHEVSLDDLAPVPTCEECTFMVQSAPNTPQAVPFLGKTYNITIPPGKMRGCFLTVWLETSVRSGSKKDDEVGEETKLEAESFLLRVPVKAFALPELKSAMNFELMDTPGPNEAHAHLQTELRTSLKKADVILYVLDYTKLATSDEKDMFETLKTYASAMLTSVDTRFWFVLNKVDAMKVHQDMETVKKSVADRINLMCEDIKVSPHQILPISALHGFLGRQGQNAQRVSEDRVFVKEFLKRACTMYEEMYPDPADWPGLVTQFAPALIRKSMMLNLEKTIFLKVVQVKAQLLGETVCDQLSNALINSSNVVQVELASLQASQSDIEVRLCKFDEVKTELSDRLKFVTHQVAQANHFESIGKTVNKYFTQMKSEVTEIVNELFSTAPSGQVKSRLKMHLNMFGDKKNIQAINARSRREVEKKIKDQDEKMSALMEAAYKQCTQDISDALSDEYDKLQSTLRKLCQPVLDFMMQRTGQSMDVTLRRSKVHCSKNTEIFFATELSKQQKTAQMVKEKKVQKDKVEEEVKTWHLLGLMPTPFTQTDRKVTKEMVTESYNVDLSVLKQHWVKWIDDVSENIKQTAATTISSMITEEVQRVSREIKEKCNSAVATVCKSQAQFGGDMKALAARTSELVALNDVLQALIEKTNKVWTSLVVQNSEEETIAQAQC